MTTNNIQDLVTALKANESTSLEAALAAEDRAAEVVMLLLDGSSSMNHLLKNGLTRMTALGAAVREVQAEFACPMIAFTAGRAFFVSDAPASGKGGTPLLAAIDLALKKGATRLVVVSDGMPGDPTACIARVVDAKVRTDVIFVGNPDDYGRGFMQEISAATGGKEFLGDLSEQRALKNAIVGLLEGGAK